jgi:hypothetical protein
MWELEGMEAMNAMRKVRGQLQQGDAPPIAAAFRDEESLRELFEGVGLTDVETTAIDVSVTYASVDELWEPATRVGGPGGPVVDQFSPEQLERARSLFDAALGSPTAPFTLGGRAAAVRVVSP